MIDLIKLIIEKWSLSAITIIDTHHGHVFSIPFDSSIINHNVNFQCAEDVPTFIPVLCE